MIDVITPHGACLVLASIDLRKWGGRGQVVSFIAAHEDWCQISTEALELITKMKRPWLQRLMGYLVTERVLERIPGRGTRPNAYRLQADITAWVGVPWVLDAELVAHRVRAFHDEHERAARTADDLLAARSYSARLGVVGARSYSARAGSLVARQRNARLEPGQGGYPRALGTRDKQSLPARHGNARLGHGALGGGSSTGETETQSPPSSGSEEQNGELTPELARAIRAVKGRVGGWLNGRPLAKLARLVDEHGVDQVLVAINQVPAGDARPPRLIDEVEVELLAGPAEDPPPPADTGVVDLNQRRRVEGIRRQIAIYEADGSPVPEDLLAELAACDNDSNPGGS